MNWKCMKESEKPFSELNRAEIDLTAIASNVTELRRITRPEAQLLVAVKANAYGHGIVEVAQQAIESGAGALGVARLPEAVMLRDSGIEGPILIFGYTPPDAVSTLIRLDLTQAIYSVDTAKEYAKRIGKTNKRLKVHLKVDSGMGRLGLLPDSRRYLSPGVNLNGSAEKETLQIAGLQQLDLEGVFTHFASSDSADKTYAEQQFATYLEFINRLKRAGLEIQIRHAANSGAIIDLPHTHLDMVRAGISLYGLYPSDEVDRTKITLRPAMSLKARIIHLKTVPAGSAISYGMTHITNKPTTIATIPIGYADGYNRRLTNRGIMLVKGVRAPIVGRVCMDLTMLDVGHISDVNLEDEVVIIGQQGNDCITADEIASLLGTINYEVTSAITARVPRVFLKNGR
jgi:alanine racemase